MNLKELLTGFSYQILKGTEDITVTELVYDSSWTFSHNPGFTLPEADQKLGFNG